MVGAYSSVWLEQSAHNREVPGSNPGGPTNVKAFSMIMTPFHVFIDFVQCQDKLILLSREKKHLEYNLSTLLSEHQIQKEMFEKLHENMRSMQKNLHDQEQGISTARVKKRETERKMDRITNPRELASLQQELEALEQAIGQHESEIVDLWGSIEIEQETIKASELQMQQKIKDIERQEHTIRQNLVAADNAIEEQKKLCEAKSKEVRPEWLEKYRMLKMQIDNPVVTIVNNACSGCFSTVPPQIVLRAERHELVPCPLCKRLLYILRGAHEAA
jgi:predicted  nucleic acid-binding Zn-ribbon protein